VAFADIAAPVHNIISVAISPASAKGEGETLWGGLGFMGSVLG
jgi:hypothetical protein